MKTKTGRKRSGFSLYLRNGIYYASKWNAENRS